MKYLGLILVLALVAGQVLAFGINENDSQLHHLRYKRSLDDKFYTFLENFKTTLREGNDTLGIPVMDPFVSKELNYVINETIAQGTVQLRNVNAVGVAGYNINKAEIALFPPAITIGLTWPHIFVESGYTFKVLVANKYHGFGDGNIVLTVNDLSFESTLKLSIFGGVKVKSMETKIALGGLKLNITGLFNDEQISEIIGIVVSDTAPELVETYQAKITAFVNEKAIAIIDSKLEGKTLQDIIHMLG